MLLRTVLLDAAFLCAVLLGAESLSIETSFLVSALSRAVLLFKASHGLAVPLVHLLVLVHRLPVRLLRLLMRLLCVVPHPVEW